MANEDVFTGLWIFSAERSKLSTPVPRSWVQKIEAAADRLEVEEKILGHDGSSSVVTIRARFDGEDYAVTGSALADTFAYRRDGAHIAGTGKKSGAITIRETVVVSDEEPVMTLMYSIFAEVKEVASGVAVFERV